MSIDTPGFGEIVGAVELERSEHIPDEAEVMGLFRELTEGKEFIVTRRMEDGQGLYLLEIELPDADGEKKEYLYVRKGPIPKAFANDGQFRMTPAVKTAIHVTIYNSIGIPYAGESVKKCDNEGNWRNG